LAAEFVGQSFEAAFVIESLKAVDEATLCASQAERA
jgi:hypothetical protein